jgi:molybdopterin synthase sulfur carrier subunit
MMVAMNTRLLFFGRITDQLGKEREIEIPEAGCTVGALRRLLAESDPVAAELLAGGRILASVEQEMAGDDVLVRPGQEVAFFSPLSGG